MCRLRTANVIWGNKYEQGKSKSAKHLKENGRKGKENKERGKEKGR